MIHYKVRLSSIFCLIRGTEELNLINKICSQSTHLVFVPLYIDIRKLLEFCLHVLTPLYKDIR